MDNKEEKSETSQLSIEEVHEHKSSNNIDQVIIDPPKIITTESDANTDAEQVKDEEENNNDQVIVEPPKIVTIESDANRNAEQVKDTGVGNKNEQVGKEEKDRIESSEIVYTAEIKESEKESKCRPIAFLLGLPFALISLVIAFIGGIIWIIGLMLTCICPCCFCVTMLVEMALALVNAPFQFFQFITDKIPF